MEIRDILAFLTVLCFALAAVVFLSGLFWPTNRKLVSTMKAAGRFMEWEEVRQKLEDGEGQLVFHFCNDCGGVWWCPDRVASFFPSFGTEQGLCWCANFDALRTLNKDTIGKCSLTKIALSRRKAAKLRREFPKAKIVEQVCVDSS